MRHALSKKDNGMFVKEIDVIELAQWLEEKGNTIKVIDVREPREIAMGTIPGAEPMPLATLPLRVADVDPNATVVFMCRSGVRSAQACMYLGQRGYDKVYNLRGGIIAWAHSGLPAELPKSA